MEFLFLTVHLFQTVLFLLLMLPFHSDDLEENDGYTKKHRSKI
ncbi:hypothetical protein [Lysinibacillus xylanilyticus]